MDDELFSGAQVCGGRHGLTIGETGEESVRRISVRLARSVYYERASQMAFRWRSKSRPGLPIANELDVKFDEPGRATLAIRTSGRGDDPWYA